MINQSFNDFYVASKQHCLTMGTLAQKRFCESSKEDVLGGADNENDAAQGSRSGERGMWWGRTDGGEFPEL